MELIMVLVIMGMVAAVVGPRVYNQVMRGRAQVAILQISEFSSALELFAFDMGRFPTSAEGLEALVRNPTGADIWNGPYLKKNTIPTDPWDKSYVYKYPGDHGDFDICSMGPDGTEGTNDDICNWQ